MKILVTGGGTGGHIYPALSFVDYVKEIDPTAEFIHWCNKGAWKIKSSLQQVFLLKH